MSMISTVNEAINRKLASVSFTDIIIGTVISLEPLQIRINNRIVIGLSFIEPMSLGLDDNSPSSALPLTVGEKVQMIRYSNGQRFYILGKSTNASTIDYLQLQNKPKLNTANSNSLAVNSAEELNGTVLLHKVAKTGNYNDLSGLPSINNRELKDSLSLDDLGIKQDYNAGDIEFSDGETLQDKYNNSTLCNTAYILDDLPIGSQFAYSSVTNIPEGCLVCDGSAVSRTDYSELFAVIGTTYGEGDGSTTFNLPDKRGRVSVGLDTTQTEFNTLGKHIGEKTHTLTIDEMPNHDHYITAADQAATGNQIGSPRPYSTSGPNNRKTEPVGGNQPHNNIQPSEVDIWLIKAKQKAINVLPDAIIYNGLDSTSTTNALSANMGNVLNEKISQSIGSQVGDIVVMPTNTSPASRLGGTWELIDKEFKSLLDNTNSYFTATDNVELLDAYVMRAGHNIKMRISFYNKVALGDSTVDIGTVDYTALGCSGGISFGLYYLIGASDGGQGVIEFQLIWNTGVLNSVDVITRTGSSIPVDSLCYVLLDILLVPDLIDDSACDKFYWKRVA